MPGLLHESLINQACEKGWSKGKTAFLKHLNGILKHDDWTVDIEATEIFKQWQGRPDAWKMDIRGNRLIIRFLEVESQYPLSSERLKSYAYLWFNIDSTDLLMFELWIMDRGGKVSFINLERIYYEVFKQKPLPEIDDE